MEPGREREKREREGGGELNRGRREGEIYFKLGTQVRVNRRRDRKGDQIILKKSNPTVLTITQTGAQ